MYNWILTNKKNFSLSNRFQSLINNKFVFYYLSDKKIQNQNRDIFIYVDGYVISRNHLNTKKTNQELVYYLYKILFQDKFSLYPF